MKEINQIIFICLVLLISSTALARQPAVAEKVFYIEQPNINLDIVAQKIATPRFGREFNFERAISSPHLAQMDVGGKKYIYICFRVREDASDVIRLARIKADQFSNGVSIRPIEKWEWIDSARFSRGAIGDVWPIMPSIVGIDGKLLITYKRGSHAKGRSVPPRILLFDPKRNKVIWEKDLPEITGYAGPTGVSLPSLTRVTYGTPSKEGDYFDSWSGRVVLGYGCYHAQSRACQSEGRFRDGFYIQEIRIINNELKMRAPVRILKDEVPFSEAIQDGLSQYRLWKKQNFLLSSIGKDTLLFSINYNVTNEHDKRPVNRDYPCCGSFFQIVNLSRALDVVDEHGFLDLSPLMPKEENWTINIKNDSPWDQGAIWSQIFYVDPFQENASFVLYESWGAKYTQPTSTATAFYPGSIRKVILRNTSLAKKSCNEYCSERRYNGGACLAATALGEDAKLHGTEIPHKQSLESFIHKNAPLISSAIYVCSDIGTREGLSDIGFVRTEIPDFSNLSVAKFGDKTCREAGYKGYIRAEQLRPSNKNESGFTLDPNALPATGTIVEVTCSSHFSSQNFAYKFVAKKDQSCDMACDSLGQGNGTGFRPYHSEYFTAGAGQQQCFLEKAGVDPDFAVNMSIMGDEIEEGGCVNGRLICICGPGRTMRATMSSRRFQLK